MTLQEAYRFIDEQERTPLGRHDLWFQLAIAEKATDDLVGDVGLCVQSPGLAAEIGFSVAPSFQHRGYGLEACGAAIDLVFRTSAVATVEAVVDVRNTPAVALVHRLGMILDRTENALFKGQMCSEHHFVLRRDSNTRRAQSRS
jgi:RimJ/RimL family protein N-acetyltransferase